MRHASLERTLPFVPILLFGMPRSGTTWIGKIFDSHPDTLYRHEPDTARRMADVPLFVESKDFETHREAVSNYVAQVAEMRHSRVAARLPLFPKDYLSVPKLAAYRLGAAASKLGTRAGFEFAVPFAPTGRSTTSCRLVWKSIESLGRLGLLMHSLPDARAVHIVRHPCGYVNSVLRGEKKNLFTHGDAAEDYGIFEELCRTGPALRHTVTINDLRHLTPSERLAWRWVLYNEIAAEQASEGGDTRRLYYEKLCRDPRTVAKEMLEFAGLSWCSQTEAFLTGSTRKSETSYYSIVKDPIVSAWKWREQMNQESIQQVLNIARRSAVFEPYHHQAALSPP